MRRDTQYNIDGLFILFGFVGGVYTHKHKYTNTVEQLDCTRCKIYKVFSWCLYSLHRADHIRHSPSLLRDLAFLSLLVESLSDFMEPVGLFVYCSFSGELSETSALPTIWQMSGELGVREVPIPCRMVAVE